jgi:glycosyltransferase involved in cell wall biosynthesis
MYNEETGAEKCVRTVCKVLDELPYRTALIVVNDASRDRTGEILFRLAPEFRRLIILTHSQNRGYGGGLKTGARRAAEMGFDYVLFMDSDLTNDPKYLPLFIERMLVGYDVIKASRYTRGGGVVGVPVWKVFISVIGNRVASLLYGLPMRDCTNGFRAVRTAVLKQMQLQENGFVIIMEELYQAKFLDSTFCEVPCTLTARAKGDKPSSFFYRPKVFYDYLKYAAMSFLNRAPRHISQPVPGGF